MSYVNNIYVSIYLFTKNKDIKNMFFVVKERLLKTTTSNWSNY